MAMPGFPEPLCHMPVGVRQEGSSMELENQACLGVKGSKLCSLRAGRILIPCAKALVSLWSRGYP